MKLVVKERMGMIILSPSVAGHKYEPYMEAWHLLGDHTVAVPKIQGVAMACA